MPRQYEAIRDRFVAEGKPRKEAQARAARIYNARNPGNPVGGGSYDSNNRKKKRKVNRRLKRMKKSAPDREGTRGGLSAITKGNRSNSYGTG